MVILKKLTASSLNEVLVATTIIVVVFGIAMAILSNLLRNISLRNNYEQNTLLNEFMYQYQNDRLKIPYTSSNGKFTIEILRVKKLNNTWISFEITSKRSNKKMVKKLIANE